MSNELAEKTGDIMERLVTGDLSGLTPAERAQYVVQVCKSLNLNPATSPFQFISFPKGGGIKLYATKDATEQLRKRDNVSVKIISRELLPNEVYVVTARATIPGNPERTDESIGAVNLKGLGGDYLANAIMKAETKAKRRVTLSICGLGFLDESEIDSIPGATILDQPKQQEAPKQIEAPKQETQKIDNLTEDQCRQIVSLYMELGIPQEEFKAKLKTKFGADSLAFITRDQANFIIDALKKTKANKLAAAAPNN